MDKVTVPAVGRAIRERKVIVIDEIGKMELLSAGFREAVMEVLGSGKPVLGTITMRPDPVADSTKTRPPRRSDPGDGGEPRSGAADTGEMAIRGCRIGTGSSGLRPTMLLAIPFQSGFGRLLSFLELQLAAIIGKGIPVGLRRSAKNPTQNSLGPVAFQLFYGVWLEAVRHLQDGHVLRGRALPLDDSQHKSTSNKIGSISV
ncbi:MAG: hypothetical protein HY675_10495 [Chloroflexi bacterium]|nr:hypothetical protein [Chloroflexota bacterium]